MTVRHVLLDADGVLQELPGGWIAAVEPFLGERAEEFMLASWSEELPSLRGDGDFLAGLARNLRAHGSSVTVEELYPAVWHSIEVEPRSIELVHRLRRAGYSVHLGTNQERHRAAYMRSVLGYDDLFDVSVYSWEVGAAKPDPAYFERAVELIGAPASEVLFVDDREDNVLGAREAGLVAERWHLEQGHPLLEELLAAHGVVPADTRPHP